METIPPATRSGNGIWIEFDGGRWYSTGATVSFSPDRFVAVGAYHGFPVYREASGASDRIWIPVVLDGLLGPYERR